MVPKGRPYFPRGVGSPISQPISAANISVTTSVSIVLWLVNAPYGPRFRKGAAPPKRAVRGFADIVQAMREIAGDRIILSMTLLAGCASFFIGNATMHNCPGSPKISAMAIRASPTACCSPQMPRAVCWPGWCSKAWLC